MVGTLKEITENYENEKLAKLQMIKIILRQMLLYVHDATNRVEDDFDDCENFEDDIIEIVIKNTSENLKKILLL